MGRKAYTKAQKVEKFLERNAGAKASEVSKATGVDIGYVYVVKSNSKKLKVGDVEQKKATKGEQLRDLVFGVTKGRGRGRPRLRMQTAPTEVALAQTPSGVIQGATGAQYKVMDFSVDNVNSPSHYKTGGIETIDFIEAKQLGYNLGNVVKYVSRAHYKGMKIEDLKKAEWYLKREIANMEKSK
jgi:hypothetical protein